jgi:hypothetical protein
MGDTVNLDLPCIDRTTWKTRALPDDLRTALLASLGQTSHSMRS